MNSENKVFARSKYVVLSEHGSRMNLSFTSHLILGNRIVALDGIRKCLLVLDIGADMERLCFIDLNDIATITLSKVYGSIEKEELAHKIVQDFLEKVQLKFEFSNKNETIVLPFYDANTDASTDRARLEKNAANWQQLLSKMLAAPIKK
ncbi:hypothetical protein [Niastella sp. OAS944]|uniref:hypothetical protein n=1 Tax=Niastella sp. OAS944 TaxID=2664089 RepID=UPI00348E213F|nr:hypothetical protein [Chitinophagaceae bacterium OAS944]